MQDIKLQAILTIQCNVFFSYWIFIDYVYPEDQLITLSDLQISSKFFKYQMYLKGQRD